MQGLLSQGSIIFSHSTPNLMKYVFYSEKNLFNSKICCLAEQSSRINKIMSKGHFEIRIFFRCEKHFFTTVG